MEVELVRLTRGSLAPKLETGQVVMRVWHRVQSTLESADDGAVVVVHQVLIICADIKTARAVYAKVSKGLMIDSDGWSLDENQNVILTLKPISCACDGKPHGEADEGLFVSLCRVLARD